LHNIRVFQNLILYTIFLGKYHDAHDAETNPNLGLKKHGCYNTSTFSGTGEVGSA
jgi:hypothetical protein